MLLLTTLIFTCDIDFPIQICSNFHNFGMILAKVIPRCSDPDLVVRQHAIDCVHTLMKIQQRYQGSLITGALKHFRVNMYTLER